jgi:hypothetical protein
MWSLISTNTRPKDSDAILLITDALVNSLWKSYILSWSKLLITINQTVIVIAVGAAAEHAANESEFTKCHDTSDKLLVKPEESKFCSLSIVP